MTDNTDNCVPHYPVSKAVAAILPHINPALDDAAQTNGCSLENDDRHFPRLLAASVVETVRVAGWTTTQIIDRPGSAVLHAVAVWNFG